MSKRKQNEFLKDEEIAKMLEEESEDENPLFSSESDGGDDDYSPSDSESDIESGQYSNSSDEDDLRNPPINDGPSTSNTTPANTTPATPADNNAAQGRQMVLWDKNDQNFVPRFSVTPDRPVEILNSKLNQDSSELDIFLQVFPKSLLNHITSCTNLRLQILRDELNKPKKKKKKAKKEVVLDTDVHEIKMLFGIMLVMSYNHVPELTHYWSTNESLGNVMIKRSMSRNRFQLLVSKLYAAIPQKPQDNTSKTYYVDEFLECVTNRFRSYRSDSPYQSIDEAMTKFKGRSALKQYLPMKPTKRGIKLWVRSDSKTGYTYDCRVYAGKSGGNDDIDESVTLGEKVIKTMTRSTQSVDVTFAFDRFFTSVNLMATLDFPCVGTAMSNRRNMPKFYDIVASKKTNKPTQVLPKLTRSKHEFMTSSNGILAARWRDTKEVLVLSNCHDKDVTQVNRRQKNGDVLQVSCPESIKFYNEIMDGVDLGDQKVRIYDLDRKSTKWWKKVIFRTLMVCVVNAWIICQELRKKKFPLLQFLVPLSESLIQSGKSESKVQRRAEVGRPSDRLRTMAKNNMDHMVSQGKTRRRCALCASKKIESRTKIVCTTCKVALCIDCFKPYHK